MQTVEQAIQNWLDAVDALVIEPQLNKEFRDKHGTAKYYSLHKDGGQKFLRIVSHTQMMPEHKPNISAWAFVALQDGSSKALGSYKQGDILKAASFKVPAKHARGNVFDLSKGPACGVQQWTGPNYLK